MVKREKIIQHLRAIIAPYLSKDIKLDFHNEFHYNSKVDCDFTIKVLTGAVQGEVVRLPFQIIVEVKETMVAEVSDCLSEFVKENNNTEILVESDKINQFYNFPVVLQNFVARGCDKVSILSMDGQFIIFEGVTSTDTYLSFNVDGVEKRLDGFLNVSFSTKKATEGVISVNALEQKNIANSSQTVITAAFHLKRGSELHLELAKNVGTNKEYAVKFFNGIIEREYSMFVLEWTESITFGDIISVQFSLCTGRGEI